MPSESVDISLCHGVGRVRHVPDMWPPHGLRYLLYSVINSTQSEARQITKMHGHTARGHFHILHYPRLDKFKILHKMKKKIYSTLLSERAHVTEEDEIMSAICVQLGFI